MRIPLSYIISLLLFIAYSSCSEEKVIDAQLEKDFPSIFGEISPFDSLKIKLKNVTNRTYKDYKSNAIFTEAKLLNEEGKTLSTLHQRKNNLWTSSFFPKANTTYRLSTTWNGKKIETITKIPDHFIAKISQREQISKDSLALSITLTNSNQNLTHYFIEYVQIENEERTPLHIHSNQEFLDNNKYNEIKPPFKYLFFKTREKKVNLKIRIAYLKNRHYELIIKKLNKDYYDVLYSYKLQEQDNYGNIIITNASDFVGILGGYYPIHLPL